MGLKDLFGLKSARNDQRALNIIFTSALKQVEVEGEPWKHILDFSNIKGLANKMCLQIEEEFKNFNIKIPIERIGDSNIEKCMKDLNLNIKIGYDCVRMFLVGHAYKKYFSILQDSIKKQLDTNEQMKSKYNLAFKFDIDKILN